MIELFMTRGSALNCHGVSNRLTATISLTQSQLLNTRSALFVKDQNISGQFVQGAIRQPVLSLS